MRYFVYSVSIVATLASCAPKRMVSGFYDLPVECISRDNPNEILMVIFSSGRNKGEALQNARRSAVNVVLFGANKASSSCFMKPLFNDVQRTKNREYFTNLMLDEAFIEKATLLSDERLANKVFRDVSKSRKQITQSFVVTVNLSVIERKIKSDDIK